MVVDFPAPFWPQQAKAFPRLNGEGEIVDNGDVVIDLVNVLDTNCRCHEYLKTAD
jgi:hypothetical protein